MELFKTLHIFQEKTFQALKKIILFQEIDFLASSLKNCYILGGNFKVPSLKKFLIFFLFF